MHLYRGDNVNIAALFVILAGLLFLLMFGGEIVQRCSCCSKRKFRLFIKLRGPSTANADRQVCARCCRRYSIGSIEEFEQLDRIRQKVEMDPNKLL